MNEQQKDGLSRQFLEHPETEPTDDTEVINRVFEEVMTDGNVISAVLDLANSETKTDQRKYFLKVARAIRESATDFQIAVPFIRGVVVLIITSLVSLGLITWVSRSLPETINPDLRNGAQNDSNELFLLLQDLGQYNDGLYLPDATKQRILYENMPTLLKLWSETVAEEVQIASRMYDRNAAFFRSYTANGSGLTLFLSKSDELASRISPNFVFRVENNEKELRISTKFADYVFSNNEIGPDLSTEMDEVMQQEIEAWRSNQDNLEVPIPPEEILDQLTVDYLVSLDIDNEAIASLVQQMETKLKEISGVEHFIVEDIRLNFKRTQHESETDILIYFRTNTDSSTRADYLTVKGERIDDFGRSSLFPNSIEAKVVAEVSAFYNNFLKILNF